MQAGTEKTSTDTTAMRVLVVEPDPVTLEVLVAGLIERFDTNITCVSCGEDALQAELIEPHDLVITELELDDMPGLALAEQLAMLRTRPMILLAEEPTAEEAIAAMQAGIRDMLPKPFRISRLLQAVERALLSQRVKTQHQSRYQRMRKLLKRVIRERRELNHRVELICKDLVGAHKRLVHRVIQVESSSDSQR